MGDASSKTNHLTGQLLIAMPNMGDQRFDRSVVLMCSHAADHAMGVIINKTLDGAGFGELLDQLSLEAPEHIAAQPVHYGGPVQQDRGLVIHSLDYQSANTLVVNDEIGVTGTRDILSDIASGGATPRSYFLTLGHAGWAPGQLEDEIASNAWAHVDADRDLVFSDDDIWKNALERLGVTGAMLSPEWATARPSDAPLN
ncbi:MAG: YqgE/AlgH family protein [Pseudomonadota bacterium]